LFDGFLNVNKPSGVTSHDVVNQVRRLLHKADRKVKVGHAGTLDPLADGVLVVCLGRATRLSDYVMHGAKGYQVVARFGQTTNTYDVDGVVVAAQPCDHLTARDIQRLLPEFTGAIMQRPPAYSAIKQGGRKLYELARSGQSVEAEPRLVQVYRLELVTFELPHAMFNVECGAGTYIRSLVHDIGQRLGVGAHVLSLTRTFSGTFWLRDSLQLEQISTPADLLPHLIAPIDALTAYPRVQASPAQAADLARGRSVAFKHELTNPVMVYDEAWQLIAVAEWQDQRLHPRKVFMNGALP
jgi:tRNA pseudouridine55 synthase